MSYKFAKTLLAGSVFAMGAFGLIACGDDSGSTKPSGNESKPISVDSRQDASIAFSGLAVVNAGTSVKLTGSISLDFTDTLSSAAPENLNFTNVDVKIGKVQANGGVVTIAAEPSKSLPPFPRNGTVSLTESNILFALDNAALTECGDYQFIISAEASDGAKKFSNTQTVNFTRPEMYCKSATPASSASAQPTSGVEMVPCPDIVLTTDMNPGLDLATCTATPSTTADIVIKKSKSSNGNDYSITSGNGTLFAAISNSEDYYALEWPDQVKGVAYMSDFKYRVIDNASIDNMKENDMKDIYVAKTAAFNEATGAGFFAFGVPMASEGNNGNFTVTMKVYKAK